MTDVRHVTRQAAVAFTATSLETGDEAVILTTPVPINADTAVLPLTAGWRYNELTGKLYAMNDHWQRRRAS